MRALSLLLASLLILFLPTASDAQNRQCQRTSVVGSAHFGNESLSRNAAQAAWVSRTTVRHGLRWSNWGNAADRRITCRIATMATGMNGHRCDARARPCVLN